VSSLGGLRRSGRAELARLLPGRRFVTPQDAADVLGLDITTAAQKLARWTEAGWLRRVRRGLYVPVPVDVEHPEAWSEDARVIAARVWDPCYFTGWTAANQWALTEQPFRTTVLKTNARVRRSSTPLLEHTYLVVHAPPELFEWGLTTVWHGEVRLKYADEARTVIDVLDAPKLAGGVRHAAEILDAYLETHEAQELMDYGDHLGNSAVFKRLGYLLEHLGHAKNPAVTECRRRVRSGVSMLDPSVAADGPRNSRWGLRENVRIEELGPS
jgi:predicted transcriptional regulator of viral defense system